MQAAPSARSIIVFLLRGDYELCFRLWVRFGRSRARWKRYLLWAAEPHEDAERRHLVLCELKRAAQFKHVQRMFVERPRFFPRRPFVSLELTLRHVNDDRGEERKNAEHWTFETAAFFGPRPTPAAALTYTTLVRSLLLRLHDAMRFQLCEFGEEKPKEVRANTYFERLRTRGELSTRIASNRAFLRTTMHHKMQRDHAILSGMMSHMAAARLAQSAQFSLQPSSTCLEKFDDVDGATDEVVIFPDVEESVVELLKQEQAAPPRIPNLFSKIKAEAIRAFDARLRDPQCLLQAPPIRTSFDAESKNDGDIRSRPAQNALIVPFTSDAERGRIIPSYLSAQELFNLPNFKDVLEKYPTTIDVMAALQRFFLGCSGVQLDVSSPLSIARSSALYPAVDQHKRRRMMRNIAAFIAEYAGLGEDPGVAMRVSAPQVIIEAINAILTVHAALRLTPLSQYCDECPFTKKAKLTDALVNTARMRIWQAMRLRFPALELIAVGGNSLMSNGGRFRNSAFTFPAGVRVEEMRPSDALLVVFVLPMILQFDAVVDFASDEIIGRGPSQE
jgi:hypothetical protein